MSNRWLLVILLAIVALLNYLDRQVIFSLLPLLRGDLHLTDPQMGLLGATLPEQYGCAGVSSVDPSSTTSTSTPGSVCAATLASASSTKPPWLKQGMTTVTGGVAPDAPDDVRSIGALPACAVRAAAP